MDDEAEVSLERKEVDPAVALEEAPTNFFSTKVQRCILFHSLRKLQNGPHDIAERSIRDVVERHGECVDVGVEGACPEGRELRVHGQLFFFSWRVRGERRGGERFFVFFFQHPVALEPSFFSLTLIVEGGIQNLLPCARESGQG